MPAMTMTCTGRSRAMLLVAGVLPVISANVVLRQLHIVTRHGSPRTIVDGESNFPLQSLSDIGVTQMENLGAWIRMEYEASVQLLDDDLLSQYGETSGFVEQYYPVRLRLESSAYDTTILSAQALARGLFPSKSYNQVPVYSQSGRNDISIASDDQCPSFLHDISVIDTGKNMDFNEMEEAYMNQLTALASLPMLSAFAQQASGVPYIPLRSLWKAYDLVREAKITCTQGYDSMDLETCSKLTFPNAAELLTDIQWKDLRTLVRYAEVQAKYGTDRAARLLASNLLQHTVERMVEDLVNKPHDDTTKRVYVSSAEYPVILALMSLLKIDPDDNVDEEVIPAYGSAFIFELYQDELSLEHTVRLKYKAAGKDRPSVLRMSDHCHDKAGCTMQGFSSNINNLVLHTKAWCQECGNDYSDICLFYSRMDSQDQLRDEQARFSMILHNLTNVEPSVNSTDEFSDDAYTRDGFAVFFGGVAAGVFFTGLIFVAIHCLRKAKGGAKSTGFLASWHDDAMSPTSSVNLDADELSTADEDEDHSSDGTPGSPKSDVAFRKSSDTKTAKLSPEIV